MQHQEVKVHRFLSVHQETKLFLQSTAQQHYTATINSLSKESFWGEITGSQVCYFSVTLLLSKPSFSSCNLKSLLDWVWKKVLLVLWRLAKKSKPTNSTSATGSWTLHCWQNALPPKSLLITWVAVIAKEAGDPNGDSFLYCVSTHHSQ